MGGRISRRDFVGMLAATAAGAALTGGRAGAREGGRMAKGPNLVFVFADEMRQQSLGFLGQDPVITPNLDRFASRSLFVLNASSNYPVCSPYRAMLMTGKFPLANGVTGNCTPDSHKLGIELREADRCLPDVLKDAGYACGYVGKWHLDSAREPNIPADGPQWWDSYIPGNRRHGFDFWHAYNCFDDHNDPHYWSQDSGLNDKIRPRKWSPEHETDVAIGFIRNRGGGQRPPGKPFALFMSHNPPHMPFHMVPEKYVKQYGDARPEDLLTRPNADRELKAARDSVKHHFAQVTGVDDNFGRLLKCLEEEGLEEDTIVVFTSDHGEMMGSHGLMHKQQPHEESFLVPFLIRWPGKIGPGRSDLHLSVPDLMPTLLALMGVTGGIPGDLEGSDRSPILLGKGGEPPRFAAYYRISPEKPRFGRRGLRTDRYTFMVEKNKGGKRLTLFDRREDPYELRNVAAGEPKAVRDLTAELKRWLKRTGDPFSVA